MIEINCPSCLSSNILEDRQVARDINCITCGATFFVEKITEEEALAEQQQRENVDTEEEHKIVVSTGSIPGEYEVLDTVFALDTLNKNFFTKSSPSLAFKGAKAQLRARAEKIGGDAIIDCSFDYRISAGHGMFGVVHDLEIFAYGTVVKFK